MKNTSTTRRLLRTFLGVLLLFAFALSIPIAPLRADTLGNLSTRLRVETGDNALIGGFILSGTQDKKVIIRAISSSLTLPGKLENPTLELRDATGTLLKQNDDWQNSTPADKQAILDSTIPPGNDLESAIVATLPANNASYTAIVRGVNNTAGIGVIEVYDLDPAADSKLANISTRGLVQTADNVLIAGTIVLGTAPQRVIVRAIGPSLTLPGKLNDPILELRNSNGTVLRANDNWESDQEAELIGTTIPPTHPSESAIVTTLPGNGATYTAIVRGVNDETGIGVVEIYALRSGDARISSPAAGANVGSDFMIEATATPARAGETISSVSFYDGNTLLGTDSSSPYQYAYLGASTGAHALTAVALDNQNQMFPSPVVNVTVVAGAGLLTRGPYLQKAAPTEITIRWRNTLYDLGRVRYGPTQVTLNQTADEATRPGPGQFDHVVTLTGLTPDTTYFYSIGSGSDTLASGVDYTFRTPPTAGTVIDTRIWVLGDAGTAGNSDPGRQTSVRDAFYTFTGARTPNLVLQLGDNAYNTGTDNEFQKAVFDMYPTMLRKIPFWSCLGNHETGGSTAFVDTYPYFDIYTFPTAGEAGGVASGTEHYYSFDYGNIHFIALDSMTADRTVDDPNTPGVNEDGAMAAWLRTDLASTTATWIIAFFHHPPYTKGSHNSDTEGEHIAMRQNFLPILEGGGVDMTLGGHSHSYERSYLIDGHYGFSGSFTPAMKLNGGDGRPAGNGAYLKPLNDAGGHKGAVHAVAGSAGGQGGGLQPGGPHPVFFISTLDYGSLVLDINGNTLSGTFIRNDGLTPDTFTISKQ
jgi:Calcineurin-like phosphoesterase/Bacterial Ig domain/Purple acid Phosphatase, N-terminal domain